VATRRFESLPELLLGLVALAVAVVIGALAMASAVKAVKRSRDMITVTGSAKRPITADLVTWHLSVDSADSDPAKPTLLRLTTSEHMFPLGGRDRGRLARTDGGATQGTRGRTGRSSTGLVLTAGGRPRWSSSASPSTRPKSAPASPAAVPPAGLDIPGLQRNRASLADRAHHEARPLLELQRDQRLRAV
jgi:hypothetical protein